MKILYFGTVCDTEQYAQCLRRCRRRPSVAAPTFERALLTGLAENGAQVEILAFPMIPSFPARTPLWFGGRKRDVCGYPCRWLATVNLPVLKQLTRRADARRRMKAWLRENAADGILLTYSIPPFLANDMLRLAKRYGVKTVAIVGDLLRDMYIGEKSRVPSALKRAYLAPAMRVQGDFDGYIYLTRAMRDEVAPTKPYIVMEAIAPPPLPQMRPERKTRAILYAGMLHEKYGILRLLDAFSVLKAEDLELWLCGDGTAAEEIRRRAAQDGRIRLFGTLPRERVLQMERQAAILVDPRCAKERFTAYSFPSKIVEYMASGTPVVCGRLAGIPAEYFSYVTAAEDDTCAALAEKMAYLLALSDDEREKIGARSREFVLREKSPCRQARRVLAFLEDVTDET